MFQQTFNVKNYPRNEIIVITFKRGIRKLKFNEI